MRDDDLEENLEKEFKDALEEVRSSLAEELVDGSHAGSGLLPHSDKPPQLPLFALSSMPIFPHFFIPLALGGREEINLLESLPDGALVAFILVKDDKNASFNTLEDIHSVGVSARIIKRVALPQGMGYQVFISSIDRIQVTKLSVRRPFPIVEVSYLQDTPLQTKSVETEALIRNVFQAVQDIVSRNRHGGGEELRLNMNNVQDPARLADFAASVFIKDKLQQQQVLQTLDVTARLEIVFESLLKELELLEVQKKISENMSSRLDKQQREYYLREELKAIKQELGLGNEKSSEQEKFRKKIEELKLSPEVNEIVMQELEKFSLMENTSPEYIVLRNYLDLVSNLPWNDSHVDNIDLKRAIQILDLSHYGMEDVKERILEYLAIRKLRSDAKGAIICLVGPPGVGKTSIGRSIAEAMGRPFFRFSVGGMRDEAEIKGHRRTYVGAMPGKIIQGLKVSKSRSAVFMIDEIDKITNGSYGGGDPFSALLETLDPEQNNNFRDHYLDLPFDLSNVLFITTANTLETIPRPLLDRFEIIELSGYIDEEKMAIAKKHLIPKVLRNSGLSIHDVIFHASALKTIAENYAREAGMRRYERYLEKICRKVAYKIATQNDSLPYQIKRADVIEYLGNAPYRREEITSTPYPGMVMGLAWTLAGGATLIIEAVRVEMSRGGGQFRLTGRMGEVMKESAAIAYSYIRSVAKDYKISSSFFEEGEIHLHIPEGATPKDGPSAGITMASAVFSLAKQQRPAESFAMTGELTLIGRVMAIGGLREKVVAAKRNGIHHIIFPKANQVDLDEIPEHVKAGLSFYPVSTMKQVLKILFSQKA